LQKYMSKYPYPRCEACSRPCSTKNEKGLISGKTNEPMVCYFSQYELNDNCKFTEMLTGIQKRVERSSGVLFGRKPSDQAFRNLIGSWFETLIAIIAWNSAVRYNQSHDNKIAIINLPNAATMQFWQLYDGEALTALDSLFDLLRKQGINITLSNPDLICVNLDNSQSAFSSVAMNGVSFDTINHVSNAYTKLRGKCSYNALKFGIAVKSALRPDRRYQIVYEGSLLKAIISHLRTRFWDPQLDTKYYGIVGSTINKADEIALSNPSIDTITDVRSSPRKAVDELTYCATVLDVEKTIEKWLSVI